MRLKRTLSILLSTILSVSLLAGCGAKPTDIVDTTEVADEITEEVDIDLDNVSSSNKTISLAIDSFKSGSSDMEYEYTESQYKVPIDHIFEFDASEKAGYVAYDAFKVYVSNESLQEDIESMKTNKYHTSGYFCESKYNEGKIYVSPSGSVKLNENGSYNADNEIPTWGVYNRLFLAQWIDLETGEVLEKPIVTIFSVDHNIDAPIVTQTIDEQNYYTLTWNEVLGATHYSVYCMLSDVAFEYEGTTTDTQMSIKEFNSEKENLAILSTITIDDTKAELGMNYSVAHNYKNGYKYIVVAHNESGMSGLSNIVDVADIAGTIPYTVCDDGTPTYTITQSLDAPMYGKVTMVDGSQKDMLIAYKGGNMYQQPDGSIFISTRYANTNLASTFKLVGMDYEDFKAGAQDIVARQQSAISSNSTTNPDNNISEVPTNDESNKTNEAEEKIETILEENSPEDDPEVSTEEPTEEITEEIIEEPSEETTETQSEEPSETTTEEPIEVPSEDPQVTDPNTPIGYTNSEIYEATLAEINKVYTDYNINIDDLTSVLYANNQLEAYLAYALTARLEAIIVPTSVFPEATDVNYLASMLMEAYRQNPTSGIIMDLQYSYDYEALLIKYSDDTDTRLRQTSQELAKAKELSNSVVNSSMSDVEKVYAFNKYFCDNASYDFDSMSTDVDMTNLSQAFIDAHTPYGILCNNYGVCESYSEAFALAGRFAGLDVIMEIGTLNGGGHEWNKVCIDNQYYIVDITNNDMDIAANSLLLVSEEQATCLSADRSAFTFNAPATDKSKEYYANVYGLCNDEAAAKESIKQQLDSEGIANVRFDYNISQEEATQILQSIYSEGYALNQYAVFNGVVGVNLQ